MTKRLSAREGLEYILSEAQKMQIKSPDTMLYLSIARYACPQDEFAIRLWDGMPHVQKHIGHVDAGWSEASGVRLLADILTPLDKYCTVMQMTVKEYFEMVSTAIVGAGGKCVDKCCYKLDQESGLDYPEVQIYTLAKKTV